MAQNQGTILLVDDNPEICAVVRVYLGRAGFRIVEAEDGEAGLQLASRENPGLILCDEHMPRMNGRMMLMKLRQDPATAAIPVVMIAGSGMLDEEEWRRAGATYLLAKPFHLSELLDLVRTLLSPQGIKT